VIFDYPFFLLNYRYIIINILAYFEHGHYNIISVDYGTIAQSPCYWAAAHNVPLVANCTAQLLDALILDYKVFRLAELHVVGFSLGGQVAGHIHLFLKAGSLPRLTGNTI